jgi:hypothetical protein
MTLAGPSLRRTAPVRARGIPAAPVAVVSPPLEGR